MRSPAGHPPLTLVLDTNVIIDWLVFDDPRLTPLTQAVHKRHVRALTHEPAIEELRRVLNYPAFKLGVERQSAILAQYLAHSDRATLPAGFSLEQQGTPTGFPRCRDADDQHFLALAFHSRTDALVSRDKAVLKLKRQASKFGVNILTVPDLTALLTAQQATRESA